MARLVHSHPAPLILIFDWQGAEFASRLGEKPAQSRAELEEMIRSGHRVVCYDAEAVVGDDDIEAMQEVFDWFCQMAFELAGHQPGRIVFVCDELQDLIDPWNIPPSLGNILSRGGRREMDTCLGSRSGNALHTEARDQVTELYCFRLVDKNSVKYPEELGLNGDEIRNLKDTHCIYRDMRTGEQKRLSLWGKERNH